MTYFFRFPRLSFELNSFLDALNSISNSEASRTNKNVPMEKNNDDRLSALFDNLVIFSQ